MTEEIQNSDKVLNGEVQPAAQLTQTPTPPKKKVSFNDVAGGIGGVLGFIEKFLPIVKNAINDIDDIRSVIKTGQPAHYPRFQSTNSYSGNNNYTSYSRGYSPVPQASWQTRMPEVSPGNGNLQNFASAEQATSLLAVLKNRLERQTDNRGINYISLYDEYLDAGIGNLATPTFYNWGWYDLRGADVRQMGNGNWELIMPPIQMLR